MEGNASKLDKRLWILITKFSKFMVDVLGFGASITSSLVCMGLISSDKILPDFTKPPKN